MDDLRECLASLAPIAATGVPVVVALNASPDFDEIVAQDTCPGVRVVRSEANLGYAGGCNLGWRDLGDAVDAVLFLNNDVVVPPDLLAPILRCFGARPEAGVAGATVVYYDDPSRVWAIGGRINRTFGYTRHAGFNDEALPTSDELVDYVNGSAIAVRREVLERLGGWDESYFHFFDEADLCERARELGYQSYAVAGTPVRHKVSATTGHRGSAQFNRAQAYYFARNRVRFVGRHFRGWRKAVALVAQPKLVAYEALKAVLAGNRAEARGRIEGVIDGMRGRSGQRKGGW
jgi:GT2 family glycosyltransferase